MNSSEIVRHNARLIRPQVRGKNKAERQQIYALIAGGPLALIAHAAASIVSAHSRVRVEVSRTEMEYDSIVRDIERGARAALNNERRFRL